MNNVVRLPVSHSSARELGRYRLIATLGQGGMGTIHLAVAGGLGGFRKLLVVKELRPELTLNEQFLDLFMKEARLAARLSHPNVVHTVEADQENGRYFLTMEFLDGQPFSEVLRRAESEPVVPLAFRLQVVAHALSGLHYAHELRDYDGRALHVVHRDVSPANVFVTYDGQVKVLDFGIAKAGSTEGTQPGGFKGKIGYAAPEQLRGRPADRRIDVFAAGVMLWEAIALRHLVRGKPSRQVFEARLTGTEPRIAQVVPHLDPELAAICDCATHCDPTKRYPTAEAFRLALENYLASSGQAVDPAELGRFMRGKFVQERTAMHRLIETQLTADGESDSMVSPLRAHGFDTGRFSEVENLGDPGLWQAEQAGSGRTAARPRSRRAVRWLMMGALVAAGGALAVRAKVGRPADASAVQDATKAIEPPGASLPALPADVRAHLAPTKPVEPSNTAKPSNTAERLVGDAIVDAGQQVAASRGTFGIEAAEKKEIDAARRAAVVRRSSRPGARRVPVRKQRPRTPSKDHASAAPTRDERSMNLDLREVPRRAPRKLDLDNPFR